MLNNIVLKLALITLFIKLEFALAKNKNAIHYEVTFNRQGLENGSIVKFANYQMLRQDHLLFELNSTYFTGYKFEDITNIEINFNNILKLTKGTISNLLILEDIKLDMNEIKEIENGSFKNLPNLTNLVLSSNNLDEINPYWFDNVPNIKHFDIRSNQIRYLKNDSFIFLKSKVDAIFFNGNKIEFIEDGAFNGIKEIGRICFDYNKLLHLSNVFDNLKINTLEMGGDGMEKVTINAVFGNAHIENYNFNRE